MSIEAFIAALRAEIAKHHEHSLATIITGKLDDKQYGYACGYLKALDDVARIRAKDDPSLGVIEQVLSDIREE